jgi:NAD(P)-dependent dehydrogenase (short-subunit alcohol dehydrogenase family)
VTPEEFSAVIDVNLKGVHHVLRTFVPAMIARRSGIIINLSSGWGRSTSPEVAPYCATKWGIEGLTNALSHELPQGMAAIALNPGIIDTDMLRSCFGSDAASYDDAEAWSRRAVPFLLSLTARHNGKSLDVP